MSIHTLSKEKSDTIDRLMSTLMSGDFDSAIAVLNQSELTEDQKTKIAGILKEPRSENQAQAIAAMQQRIIAVVKNVVSTAATGEQAPFEQRLVSFADDETSPLGNAYPCTFEFLGKYYQSATACFLAQQYTDHPEVMDLFADLNPEDATALAELNPMTKDRKISWENPDAKHINKDDVLMHVLRAKFGQNPDLKNQLLATGDAYLVCHGPDTFLSDNMNGTGKNALGASLMLLRGEYGGTGQVEPPDAYQSAKQSLLATGHFIGNGLPTDVMGRLFYTCISQCDFTTLTVLACVNKHWNSCSTGFWEGLDLKELCPELTILDAKAQGVQCEDEPKITKFRLFKWIRELSPYVEEDAGLTQLTMTKGTTLNQLIEIARGDGVTVEVEWDQIILNLGDVPVEQSYGILITNRVFLNSRRKNIILQEALVKGHGCEMPTVQEYVALCVFTKKVFKKRVYRNGAFGRSSTRVSDTPLIVGNSTPDTLCVADPITRYLVFDGSGAGGKRKF
jgi:predicted NAD-dependent protein-ADP-ribosyltransferase YbiA (DUF1768 family)